MASFYYQGTPLLTLNLVNLMDVTKAPSPNKWTYSVFILYDSTLQIVIFGFLAFFCFHVFVIF